MCIRDSYKLSDTKYPVTFGYADQGTAVVKIAANDGKAIENDPVSYTHLDVYKRQTVSGMFFMALQCASPFHGKFIQFLTFWS